MEGEERAGRRKEGERRAGRWKGYPPPNENPVYGPARDRWCESWSQKLNSLQGYSLVNRLIILWAFVFTLYRATGL